MHTIVHCIHQTTTQTGFALEYTQVQKQGREAQKHHYERFYESSHFDQCYNVTIVITYLNFRFHVDEPTSV